MMQVPPNLSITDNEAAGQYEVQVGEHLAILQYIRRPGRVLLVHTGVPEAIEGHGVAAQLSKHALDEARARGEEVVPRCPYVRAYIDQHPEYDDVVAPRLERHSFG